jgi:tetratricopeptide (TPR) repeat protein
VSEEDAPKAIRDRNQKIRDEAAQKRKSRRDADRRSAVQRNLDAGEMVDDALARSTHAATGWLKKHFNILQWVILLGAAGGIAWPIYRSQAHKADAKATDALMAGVVDFSARVGSEDEGGVDPSTGIDDLRPHYADEDARLKAAADAFRAVGGNATIKTLATLGLAGTLYDAGKFQDALKAYQSARDSDLAKTDSDVRLRSVEGIGLSQEALGNKDAAQKSFRELGNADSTNFAALGLYHQARIARAAGDREAAKDLLKKAIEKAGNPSSPETPPGFVVQAAKELLAVIDPSSAAPANKPQLSPEQLKVLMQQSADKSAGDSGLSKEKLDELLKQLQANKPAPAPASAPSSAP